MLTITFLNPLLIHLIYLLSNQFVITIMGNYSKDYKLMKNRSNCIFKSFLVVLFMISIVHMSESNDEDVSDNPNLIETDNLQSAEDKTEEPVKVMMNQVAYFQASDDDDSEQNDASYLVETGMNSKALFGENTMIKLLRGNRMLKEPLQSNDAESLLDDASKDSEKMYLVDHMNEIERIRGYLPSLMKMKRLVKKCQCSYRDEDQYSSIKDAMMPSHVDHRVNLDYVDSDEEPDDDDRDEDDDSQYGNVLRQRNFNYNKYKRFDLNNFRDDEDMETENEDFETVNRFNEVKEEEDRGEEEDNVDDFDDNGDENNSDDDDIEDDEFDDIDDESNDDDQLNDGNNLSNNNNSEQNEKLLSPFMTNLSPTSSSDLIFNNFNNEMAMNANTLNDQTENENNEIQLAKLKRIITDGTVNTNDSNFVKDTNEIKSSDDASSALSTQYATTSNRGSRRGGGKGNKRNFFDHWILIRKRRQIKAGKSALESKKGNSGGKSTNRN